MLPKKFKAWSHDDLLWCHAFSIHQGGLYSDGDTEPIWKTEKEANVTIVQYCGISDKNKKEIFEGDILKVTWWRTRKGTKVISIIRDIRQVNDILPEGINIKDVEIIGNVFENPDLVEKLGK